MFKIYITNIEPLYKNSKSKKYLLLKYNIDNSYSVKWYLQKFRKKLNMIAISIQYVILLVIYNQCYPCGKWPVTTTMQK